MAELVKCYNCDQDKDVDNCLYDAEQKVFLCRDCYVTGMMMEAERARANSKMLRLHQLNVAFTKAGIIQLFNAEKLKQKLGGIGKPTRPTGQPAKMEQTPPSSVLEKNGKK